MSDEFDWSELDDTDIIQETVSAVAVYQNPKGDLVIRQQESLYGNGDQVVVVPREKTAALIAKIKEVTQEE